jgi:hypothetical protein
MPPNRGCKYVTNGSHSLSRSKVAAKKRNVTKHSVITPEMHMANGHRGFGPKQNGPRIRTAPTAHTTQVVPCICEEGFSTISREGIEVVPGLVHERPLHGYCADFDHVARERLIEWSRERFADDYYEGLGYKRLATSVVLCTNAPDTTPLVLRGSAEAQFEGVFPRFNDLAVED